MRGLSLIFCCGVLAGLLVALRIKPSGILAPYMSLLRSLGAFCCAGAGESGFSRNKIPLALLLYGRVLIRFFAICSEFCQIVLPLNCHRAIVKGE